MREQKKTTGFFLGVKERILRWDDTSTDSWKMNKKNRVGKGPLVWKHKEPKQHILRTRKVYSGSGKV